MVGAKNGVVLDSDEDVDLMGMTAYSKAVSNCNIEPSCT